MKIETAEELAPITDGINILLKRYVEQKPNINIVEFPFIDYFLERFNFENAGALELIAIVRTLAPVKQALKNWESFRDKAYDKTVAMGEDAERIYKGVL